MDLKPILPDSPAHEIEQYAKDTHDAALKASKARRLQGEMNWRYYLNKQDDHVKDGKLSSFWGAPYPYRTENAVRGALETQVGRMVKDLPDAYALATTPDAYARGAAQIAQDLIEYWSFEHSLDRELTRVCLWGYLSGDAGLKPTYDKEKDAIGVESVKQWQYVRDETGKRWVTFPSHMSTFDAVALARRLGVEEVAADDFEEVDYLPGVGTTTRKGVEIRERWEVPHPQCPEGLYAVFAGEKLLRALPYPYMLPSREGRTTIEVDEETGEEREVPALEGYLPLITWSPGEADDGPHGSTPVDDAVERQRLHNETISHLAYLVRISADLRRYGNKAVLDQIKAGESQFIEADASQVPKWDDPPQISSHLLREKDEGPGQIRSLIGVDQDAPQSSGSDSARKVAYVEQIDSYKLTLGHRSFQDMVEGLFEMMLKLAQTFLSDEKVYNMPHGDEVKTIAFRGGDLHGVTVRLEPRAGREKFSDVKAQGLAERAANNLGDPAEAARALATGHPEDVSQPASERITLEELGQVMRGEQPALEADPTVALPVLRMASEIYAHEGNEQAAEAAKALARAYGQKLQANPPPQVGQPQRSVEAPERPQTNPKDILPGGPPGMR